MSIELKIKSKHLSLEAQVIRFEERKLKSQIDYIKIPSNRIDVGIADKLRMTWQSINQHRRWDVRNENRATFLARAYLEGKSYKSVETTRKPENEYKFQQYIIPRIVSMVTKYGVGPDKNISSVEIKDWSKL
jgi:hypothetical protein